MTEQVRVIDLPNGKVRIVAGPFNTTCRHKDIWEIKKKISKLAENFANKERCPYCEQPVRRPLCITA